MNIPDSVYQDEEFITSNLQELKEVVDNLRKISVYNLDKGNDEISQLAVLVEKISEIYSEKDPIQEAKSYIENEAGE